MREISLVGGWRVSTQNSRSRHWLSSERPQAIYMSGYRGVQSSIYKIEALVEQDAVTLAPLVSVADMPRGEIVYTLYTYVGAYLCTGTSKGVRITAIREGGNLLVGPVVRQVNGGVKDFVALLRIIDSTLGSSNPVVSILTEVNIASGVS